MCSKSNNHPRLNSQHNWRDLYDHLTSTKIIFTLIMNKILIWAPKITRKVATASIIELLTALYLLRVSYPRRFSCLVGKSNHLRLIYFSRKESCGEFWYGGMDIGLTGGPHHCLHKTQCLRPNHQLRSVHIQAKGQSEVLGALCT